MDSKTAIETIFTLEEKLDKITAKIDLLDVTIGNLNNKIYVLNSKISELSNLAPTPYVGGVPSASVPSGSVTKQAQSSSLVLGNVRVFGYILNQSKMPIRDVYVRVFSSDNSVIKETSTDSDGYWECRLPSGRFGVEYTHKNFKPVNRPVTIPEGVSSYEVK